MISSSTVHLVSGEQSSIDRGEGMKIMKTSNWWRISLNYSESTHVCVCIGCDQRALQYFFMGAAYLSIFYDAQTTICPILVPCCFSWPRDLELPLLFPRRNQLTPNKTNCGILHISAHGRTGRPYKPDYQSRWNINLIFDRLSNVVEVCPKAAWRRR